MIIFCQCHTIATVQSVPLAPVSPLTGGVGVPQCSILGPLMFSIFVNDSPTVVDHAQINMYADDTKLHCCGEDLQCVQNDLRSDFYRVQDWLQANRLQLNISKSMLMLIGSWQKLWNHSVSVFINDKALACVTSTRYLGVIIDQSFTRKLHVNYNNYVLKGIRCKLNACNYSCDFQIFLYYACECSIIPELFSLKLQPIILKIMLAY